MRLFIFSFFCRIFAYLPVVLPRLLQDFWHDLLNVIAALEKAVEAMPPDSDI